MLPRLAHHEAPGGPGEFPVELGSIWQARLGASLLCQWEGELAQCMVCSAENAGDATQCATCGVPMVSMDDPNVLPSGTLLDSGKYEVGGRLGHGGFGITYRLQRQSAVGFVPA